MGNLLKHLTPASWHEAPPTPVPEVSEKFFYDKTPITRRPCMICLGPGTFQNYGVLTVYCPCVVPDIRAQSPNYCSRHCQTIHWNMGHRECCRVKELWRYLKQTLGVKAARKVFQNLRYQTPEEKKHQERAMYRNRLL